MTNEEEVNLVAQINLAFTPSAPINDSDLFAGRQGQVSRVLHAISQRGQHAVVFGERGVGKTSLSNIIFDLLVMAGKEHFQLAQYNCGVSVEFSHLWRSVFKQLTVTRDGETLTLDLLLPENPNPEDVREVFQQGDSPSIVVIDEFDRIGNPHTAVLLADTIKTLSDHSLDTTLILIGVADAVDQLLAEHRSIERALIQIRMPRMSVEELLEIIDKGLSKAPGISIDTDVRELIASLSHGLPPYTHLLARHSALEAIKEQRQEATMDDFRKAIKEAVKNQQHTITSAYERATDSPRENIFKEVLLACAMAPISELGFFASRDLKNPMRKITGRDYQIPAFSRHLKDFCGDSRGPVLTKTGFRFRFVNPLIGPHVLLKGLADGLIKPDQLTVEE